MLGWVGRKENKLWGLGVFSLGPPKSFLFKMRRKLKGKIGHHFWTEMPMYGCTWALFTLLFFIFFFFFLPPGRCLFFFFFFFFLFSFDLLGKLRPVLIFFSFIFLSFFCFLLCFCVCVCVCFWT